MKRLLHRTVALGAVVGGVVAVLAVAIALGLPGDPHPIGTPIARPRPAEVTDARMRAQGDAARQRGADTTLPILFGDLHVHTTLSIDAYQMSMPELRGERLHPLAQACDYARFCSGLDFWSINDHAEGLTPAIWEKTKQSIRECNAVTDPEDPDVVAFLGFEWTQVGSRPENHYGHKNVVFRGTAEDQVLRNPIAAANPLVGPDSFNTPLALRAFAWLQDPGQAQRYFDYNRYVRNSEARRICPDLPYAELPADCIPFAPTPVELFRQLRQWGGESIVIPHGNTWGLYTPAGTSWDKQLSGEMHDPDLQILVEIFSGHGNAEEYRPWREAWVEADGTRRCPPDRPDHVTGCQRAGEIVLERCIAEGIEGSECEGREVEARELFANTATTFSFATVPGTSMEDWLDSEQCTDCYLPPFRHRPGGSTQYAAAIRNFDEAGTPRRFDLGFIGSSDNHRARPGTGFKEVDRVLNSESAPGFSARSRRFLMSRAPEAEARARPPAPWDDRYRQGPSAVMLMERQNSFFFTGGLVAAHSLDRTRGSIWDALQRREVYATSGSRTLLWFDEITGERIPMGSTIARSEAPRFRATAVGAFLQQPGCPSTAIDPMNPNELEALCQGECFHPSDERNLVLRIDVIRIRPQERPDEPVDGLIEDPWRSFDCAPDPLGCTVEFSDPDFDSAARDTLYYVRAVEAEIPMVNAGTLRIEGSGAGDRLEMNPCANVEATDDCLELEHPQAWSSPIFVEYGSAPDGATVSDPS